MRTPQGYARRAEVVPAAEERALVRLGRAAVVAARAERGVRLAPRALRLDRALAPDRLRADHVLDAVALVRALPLARARAFRRRIVRRVLAREREVRRARERRADRGPERAAGRGRGGGGPGTGAAGARRGVDLVPCGGERVAVGLGRLLGERPLIRRVRRRGVVDASIERTLCASQSIVCGGLARELTGELSPVPRFDELSEVAAIMSSDGRTMKESGQSVPPRLVRLQLIEELRGP
jgi:hypothetical protein